MTEFVGASSLPAGSPSPETDIDRPRGSLRHRCHAPDCGATDAAQLLRCGMCRTVRYCSQNHQVLDRPRHKIICKKIKNAREKMAGEEERLRKETDIFTYWVGQFWTVHDAQGYMSVRFRLAEMMRVSGTLDGVEGALDHMTDMLFMGGGDSMGLHDMVPALFMRLDRDQECYDFVDWWLHDSKPDDANYPSASSRPVLDLLASIHNTLLEDADTIASATVMLLKLKFLVDIRNLKIARQVLQHTPLPPELYRPIELAVIISPVCKRLVKESDLELERIEELLLNHIEHLGRALHDANPYFVHALFVPDLVVRGDCPFIECSAEKYEELLRAVHFTYAAWSETEGVMELLVRARQLGCKDAAGEVEGMMNAPRFKTSPGSERTNEEYLLDLGTYRLNMFLELAVKDYSWLGKPEDRPSERMWEEYSGRIHRRAGLSTRPGKRVRQIEERVAEEAVGN